MNNQALDKLMALAQTIARKCPEDYEAVMVVGSVSKGTADEYSDLEIEFMVPEIPEEEARTAMITALGGTELTHYGAPLFDGSVWSIFYLEGSWVEAGWQKTEHALALMDEIRAGSVADHDRLLLASTYQSAIVLKTSPRFEEAIRLLGYYPAHLSDRIIKETLKTWEIPLSWEVRCALAKREDRMPLLQRLIPDCQRLLRILYALNHMWEHDYKWTAHCVEKMDLKPKDLAARLDQVLATKDCVTSLQVLKKLLVEVVDLMPEPLQRTDEAIKVIENLAVI